jgi:hypothetical protein
MSERRWQTQALRWGPLVAIALVLVWHSLRFDFVTDDAYITFVYSRNLAEHGQPTFNLGDPVEGTTTFLWMVLLAVPMLVGIPPEVSSRVFGVGFGIGTLFLAFRLTERLLGPRDEVRANPFAYVPSLLLALSSGFACWSSGGLETALFTFLVTAVIDGYVEALERPRVLQRVGVLLALAAMTRPEGLLLAAILGVHRVILNVARDRRWLPNVDEWLCVASFLALWAPWFAWRWWYYGWPFPNTYYVKAGGAPPPKYMERLHDAGLYYIGLWARQLGLWFASPLLVAGAIVWRPRTARFVFVTLAVPLAAAYLYYVVGVGGDFMGLHRFILPLFVIVAILVALGLDQLAALVPARFRLPAAATLTAALVCAFGWSQLRLTHRSLHPPRGKMADHGIDSPAYLIAYTENRAAIGRAMRDCFRADDFSIVGGAGAQPYFGRMRGIDVFGLVSERIAHEVAPHNPRPGHNKWGPDKLLAEHDPEFVFSCYSIHSAPTSRPLGCASFWRARGYEQVTMQIPGLDGLREERDDTRGAGPVADRYTFLVKKERAFECPGVVR